MSTFDWLFEPKALLPDRQVGLPWGAPLRHGEGRSTRRFPRRRSACCSEWAVFGARNGKNSGWPARGLTSPRSAMPAEKRKIRPIGMFAREEPDMRRWSWSFMIPRFRRSRGCCVYSGKVTIPPKGCARAMTSARNIARRFSPIPPPSWTRRELRAPPIRTPPPNAVLVDHHGNRARSAFLLRGGRASAISRQKSGRLLRIGGAGVPCPIGTTA